MSFIQKAKDGVFWTFFQQLSVQLINFIVQIFLARILLPSDFGLIAMIAIFIALGQTLSDSGMTSSLIRKEEVDDRDYGTVFLTNMLVSVGIYLLVFIAAPFVAAFYEQAVLSPLLRVFALVFVASAFSAVQKARFTRDLNFRVQFMYQLPSVCIGALVGIWMALNGYGVWSLVGLNVAQNVFFSVSIWFFYHWKPKLVFDKTLFLYHFRFGYKLTLSGVINTVYVNLYKILIGKKFSPTMVGYFTQADNLRLFPVNQLSAVLNKVTFPLFSSIQNDEDRLREAYKSSVRLVLSISTGLMLILVLISKPLFLIVFGEKWIESVHFFNILCFASIFVPFSLYNLNILLVKGRSDLFLKVEVIKKIIGVSTLLICLLYSIEAVVWGLCVTNILAAYINGWYSGKFIKYSFSKQLIDTLMIISIGLVPFAFCLWLREFLLGYDYYIQMIVTVICYFVCYIPMVLVFNRKLFYDIKRVLKRQD